MVRIKAMIVDDEPRACNALKKLLEFTEAPVDVVGVCNNPMEAADMVQALHPELLFLDVAMPGKNGFEVLKDLKEMPPEVIFITAHENFMKEAFAVSAVDYLIKPVDEQLLLQAVDRAAQRIQSKSGDLPVQTVMYNVKQSDVQKMKLCIPSIKGFQVVRIEDVLYCKADMSYTYFHLSDKRVIISSKPISEYENMLDAHHFVRIHKSYLVNLEHIKEFIKSDGASLVLDNGDEIEVSRRRKEYLMERMKAYFKF